MKFKKLIACFLLIFAFLCSASIVRADPPKFIRVVIVGDRRGGKTGVWKRMTNQGFNEDESPSDNIAVQQMGHQIGESHLVLTILDTPGTDIYYNEAMDYTKGANFVFIVHDLDKKYDEKIEQYMEKIFRDVRSKIAQDGRIVFVGSKKDLQGRAIINYNKQKTMLQGVAEDIGCECFLTSAKDNEGISPLMNYILKNFREMELFAIGEPMFIRLAGSPAQPAAAATPTSPGAAQPVKK